MLQRVFKSWSITQPNQKQQVSLPKNDLLLPDQISGRILDLELQCQKESISKDIVFQLIAQYTRAVEFYEEQGNPKYKLYQKRMHNFLNRPMIESILKGHSGSMVIKKQRNQNTIKQAENIAEKQAKQILKKHEQKQKIHETKMNQQISKQQQILQQRIRRKRISSNRSMQQKKTQEFDINKNNQQSGKKQKQKELLKTKLFPNTVEPRKNIKKVFL